MTKRESNYKKLVGKFTELFKRDPNEKDIEMINLMCDELQEIDDKFSNTVIKDLIPEGVTKDILINKCGDDLNMTIKEWKEEYD